MPDFSFLKNLPGIPKFPPFFKRESSVLGIDVGSSSIKIVQLRREQERAVLETYGELSLGPYGSVAGGQAVRLTEDKAKEALADLMREAGVKAKSAVVAIPLRASFVTVIEMPQMEKKELKEAVEYELRRYIPVPLAEVLLDWWVIPEGFAVSSEEVGDEGLVKKKKFISVLIAAIYSDVIEKYRSFITAAGLSIAAYEIEVFSAVRSLLGNELAPVLILDFGASSTKIAVVDYGIVRMAYSYEHGFQELTESIARSLGVDFARAEEMKRTIGLSDKPEHRELQNAILPTLDLMFVEAGRVLLDYRRRTGRSITRVIIHGGGAALKGLPEKIAQKFGIEVNLAEPFNRLKYPLLVQPVVKEVGPPFSTAIGLALRGLK
ncbi:MAG: type IV pilus assembly protein PilM [Candidatus Niyogibacteria bacterium]|nr:type IV pilus assembly protein PilM [Candidatus Niyogibacteria bacterium]